ncbi:MAG: YceH family protein [Woeseiaceae bacterium]
MLPKLSPIEVRVIGCLIEKSVVTPDQYPLTLNALTNACNQKSARDPVMNLTPGEVQQTIRLLEAKHLVRTDENFKSRTEKYSQRFCNTRYSNIQLDDAQRAIVCLLLLRGPQTPGELRARSGRLHPFADNDEVVIAITGLIECDGEPMLVKLPRSPGRKDSEYMHLFSGPVDIDAHAVKAQASKTPASPGRVSVTELAERVSRLEAEVASLKEQLG